MHVIYFHQYFSTPRGSTGTRSYEMAQALIRAGHRVTMVCASHQLGKSDLEGAFVRGRRRGMVEGIDLIELDLRYSNHASLVRRAGIFLKFAVRSVGIALTEKFDVAFATTTPLTAGIPAIASRWLRRKPFIFEVRDLWPELPRAMGVIRNPQILGAMSLLEWTSYHSADRLVALSPGIADGIARRGIAPDRIVLVPNGSDIDLFRKNLQPWRPESVRDNDLLAVFTGSHGLANGLDAVVDVAQLLRERGRRDIKIALIGEGKCKPALQSRAQRLELGNLIFLDPVNKVKLAGLMAGAQLGLQILANVPAFYYGTSPNKFFDYIAAGLPVLNNYHGWLAEMIVESDCGFAVPPDDPTAFADALEAAADDRAALRRKGANAARLAEQRFARPTLAGQWVDWVTAGRRA